MVLLRGCDGILQIQDDTVRAAIGTGANEFLARHRNEHQRPPNGKIVTHNSSLLDRTRRCQSGDAGVVVAK